MPASLPVATNFPSPSVPVTRGSVTPKGACAEHCLAVPGGIGQRAIDPYFLCYCCRLLFPPKTKVHYHRLPNSKRFSLSLSAFCSSTQLSSDGRPFHLNTSTTKYVARNGQLTNGEQTPEDVAFITATKVLSIDRLIIFFWPAHDWRKRVKPRSRIE